MRYLRRIILLIVLIQISTSCCPAWQVHFFSKDYGINGRRNCLKSGRELLKQIFLYKCMKYICGGDVPWPDVSMGVYIDIIPYSVEVLQLIDEYAKSFVDKIEPVMIEDYNGEKALFLNCMSAYNGKELDDFIRTLDSYLVYNP